MEANWEADDRRRLCRADALAARKTQTTRLYRKCKAWELKKAMQYLYSSQMQITDAGSDRKRAKPPKSLNLAHVTCSHSAMKCVLRIKASSTDARFTVGSPDHEEGCQHSHHCVDTIEAAKP
jgi:hypothetical protein